MPRMELFVKAWMKTPGRINVHGYRSHGKWNGQRRFAVFHIGVIGVE